MTTTRPESPAAALRPQERWRTLAYAGLPLMLAGLVPLPTLLALAVVFAATANDEYSAYRVNLSIFVLAVSGLLTLWLAQGTGDLRYLVALVFLLAGQMVAALVVAQVAERAEEPGSRAFLWLLPIFILAPHSLALLGWAAVALLRPGPDDRRLGSRWQGAERVLPAPWVWLLGSGLLAALLTLALPHVSLWSALGDTWGATQQVTVVDNSPQVSPLPQPPTQVTPTPLGPGLSAAPQGSQGLYRLAMGYLDGLTALLMLGFIAFVAAQLWWQLRRVGRGEKVPPWQQVWPLLAALALPLAALVFGLASRFSGLDVKVLDGEHAKVTPPAAPDGSPLAALREGLGSLARYLPANFTEWFFLVGGTLALLLLLAFAWTQLARRQNAAPVQETAEGGGEEEAPEENRAAVEAPPLHRVRAAYARTETYLAGAGLNRRPAETPAEYLRRAAQQWPELSGPLSALGRAYLPVRYGGGVADAQADEAEAAASAIVGNITP